MYRFSAVALFAGLAAAVHAPVGDPSGNAISAPLSEIVPACKPYTIKWQPSTPNTISILLLRGPSTNVVPIGAPIAEGIANSGSFSWTPSSDLEADTTHYGIQLIDDVTGQFQYSNQFGISKDASCSSVTSKASSASASASSGYSSVIASSTSCNTTSTPVSKTHTRTGTKTGSHLTIHTHVASTGYPISNSSIIQPTGTLTVPNSLLTTAVPYAPSAPPTTAGPTPPAHTGGAARLGAGLGMVGAIAGMVFML